MKNFLQALIIGTALIFPNASFARENITDWYLKDFRTEIIVNKDATLDITETITADCGNLPGKHGIFRVLPTRIDQKTKTPVKLESITDEKGSPYEFQETKNTSDATITWKIGDPNKTVNGENVYVIKYQVKNVIRFDNESFDELFWNLNGNFWQIETDKFQAKIVFPEEIGPENSRVNMYSGVFRSKDAGLARHTWTKNNVLEFYSTKVLRSGEGITASITFPKSIISPYKPGLWEKFGNYSYLLIPLAVFVACFGLWKKHGDDPEVDKTVIAEYEAPGNLSPLEIGMLTTNSKLKSQYITAEIINLATKGFIKISETSEKILFIKTKDFELERTNIEQEDVQLNKVQQFIMRAVFLAGDKIKLSSLKNKFHTNLKNIESETDFLLEQKGLVELKGKKVSKVLMGLGALVVFVLSFVAGFFPPMLSVALISSGIIAIVFGAIMPKRTFKGSEIHWQIKGFKLFMETAEQHRAQFYERENMFEKILPYAIIFGLTKEWIGKMREIYGAEFYTGYVPAWYAGASAGAFDADSLSSAISGVSSDIAASTAAPSSSGSGGGGFSGGGGGGGGGGGW